MNEEIPSQKELTINQPDVAVNNNKDQDSIRLEEVKTNLSDEEIVLGILSLSWGAQLPASPSYENNKSKIHTGLAGEKEMPYSLEFLAKVAHFARPELDLTKVQEIVNSALSEGKVSNTPDGKFITSLEYAIEATSDKDKDKIFCIILSDALWGGEV